LAPEVNKGYFQELGKFLEKERAIKNNILYPPEHLIFNALNQCPFDKLRVVIIGQDPYFNPKEAMGLSFSVPVGVTVPPSLRNIFKEMEQDDIQFTKPQHGDLTKWAKEGVLLLNTILTVRKGERLSHQKQGWETFTDAIIKAVDSKSDHGVVFLLWGAPAQQKAPMINTKKHCVLKAAHPSPLAADKGFFGCRHFSKTNKWLVDHKLEPVDWSL